MLTEPLHPIVDVSWQFILATYVVTTIYQLALATVVDDDILADTLLDDMSAKSIVAQVAIIGPLAEESIFRIAPALLGVFVGSWFGLTFELTAAFVIGASLVWAPMHTQGRDESAWFYLAVHGPGSTPHVLAVLSGAPLLAYGIHIGHNAWFSAVYLAARKWFPDAV